MNVSPQVQLLSVFFPMWNEEDYVERAVRAAEDEWSAGGGAGRAGDPGPGGGAPWLRPTRVDRDAVVAPRPGPSGAPRRPWSRRAVHQEQE